MRAIPVLLASSLFAFTAFGCSGSTASLPTAPTSDVATPVAADIDRANQSGPLGCSGDLLISNHWMPGFGSKDITSSGLLSLDLCQRTTGKATWSDFSSGRSYAFEVLLQADGTWEGKWSKSTTTPRYVILETARIEFRKSDLAAATLVKGSLTVATSQTATDRRAPAPTRLTTQEIFFDGIAR